MRKLITLTAILAASSMLAACNQAPPASNTSNAPPGNAAAPAPGNAAVPAGNAAAPVARGFNQTFTLNNRSNQTIDSLFVSPVGQDTWGEDIFGPTPLAPGESTDILFPREETACNYDIRVHTQDGGTSELENVNLCETSEVNYDQ
jgi:hypothetical protein